MKRRFWLVLVIISGTLGVGTACASKEQQYHGRPLEYWFQALYDSNPKVRAEAIDAIAGLAPRSTRTVNMLLSALSSESDSSLHPVFASALGRLGHVAAPAVPRLAALLSDSHIEVREAAAEALGNIGAPAAGSVPALSAALCDCCHDVRAAAADALGRMGPSASAAVPALSETLGDPISWVRLKSVEALVAIHSGSPVALAAFERALSDSREEVRAVAATGIARFDGDVARTVPMLARLLTTDPFPMVRIAGAQALGELGTVSRSALPELQLAQRDSDFAVRRAVRDALVRIGGIR